MNEAVFWEILDEILSFGEFIVAVPNEAVSANIIGKISISRDGEEIVVKKDACRCHIHLDHTKVSQFHFTNINIGLDDEACCELKTTKDEVVMRLYLRGSKKLASDKFAGCSHMNSEFVKGKW